MNERNLLILSKCSRDQSIGHAGLKVMIWYCPRGSGRSVGKYPPLVIHASALRQSTS